ncbi:conserved phage C-terminal domain-containing protein [Limosilactobacillus mucosae]|uniref:conserved phage C-terminal domain-containing protein n=1 Tax=Limosilactobacillus mucosae TaxID=97478 RepID=UPI000943553F|nr:conserved phage C-terminal domain-containing protein [Limosilactobacillus mucosae]
MSKWLFDSHPIVVDRELAKAFGLNEAIVLQQLNYWLNGKSAKLINGRKWIYNSYKQWQKDNFPFWSLATVRRAIENCEKKGLIITGNFNKAGFDKTKWYSIDYDAVDRGMSKRVAQNEQTDCSKRANGVAQNEQTNTRDYSEITTEITTDNNSRAEPDSVAEKIKTIVDYLNEKTDSHYKATTPKTKQLVQARLKEGFTVDDFKTVIDKKTATWLNDNKMNKYLRPLTLFGTKFEDYLNEKVKGQPNKNDPYYTERINPMTGQPDPNGLTRYQMDNEYW